MNDAYECSLYPTVSQFLSIRFVFRYFTMVGSKVIRPDTEYHLSVTSQGYQEPTTFRVSINGSQDDGRIYVLSKDVTFTNDQTQTLAFDVSTKDSFTTR